MRIGFAKRNITPKAETFGSFRLSGVKRHSGVHDPLFVHALAVEANRRRCLLVSVDGVAIPTQRAAALRKRLVAALGLEPASVLLAATHTHNGPETLNEEDDSRIRVWQGLGQAILGAAEEAAGKMTETRLRYTYCDLPIAINRYQHRLKIGENTVDPRLDVLAFEDAQGKHLGVLYHYAAHPTCAMRAESRISGDYCGLADRTIEKELGGFAMFFNGACGNINLEVGERSFASARRHAAQVAKAAMRAISRSPDPVDNVCLEFQVREVALDIKTDLPELDVSEDLAAWQRELERIRATEWRATIADPVRQDEAFALYQKYRTALWRQLLHERATCHPVETVSLQCLHFGPLTLVAVPGELFVEHQLWLQKQFPERRVAVVGYANGYVGYIPTRESLAAETYETQATLMHRVDGAAGAKLMTTAVECIRSLPED